MHIAQTYKALGDPVRLRMIQRLAENPYTLGTLSEGLGVSRQGARRHVETLKEAHIVTLVTHGRETKVILNNDSLKKAKSFIAELEEQWDTRLKALKEFAEQ